MEIKIGANIRDIIESDAFTLEHSELLPDATIVVYCVMRTGKDYGASVVIADAKSDAVVSICSDGVQYPRMTEGEVLREIRNKLYAEAAKRFFRQYANDVQMQVAMANNLQAVIKAKDPIFYDLLRYDMLLVSKMSGKPVSDKIYRWQSIVSVEHNLRASNYRIGPITRKLTMFLFNLKMDRTTPAKLSCEYSFSAGLRDHGNGELRKMTLERSYRDGTWPNTKTFFEDPRNKVIVDAMLSVESKRL